MFERIAPEQHDTLDGVPEPCEHAHLFGHETVASTLAEAHRAGRLHHAIVLAGPPGIGKATLAFRLACHILAHPDASSAPSAFTQPDAASTVFRLIAQDAHPSLLHLTRPRNDKTKGFKTVLTVDEVRRVSRFLSMTAHDGGYRIVIVDPADDMNNAAANALLKSLEEPPPLTLFMLITHSTGHLLPTIRSRSQIVKLSPLAPDALFEVLGSLGQDLPDTDAGRGHLARTAGGSARAAILLTQYGGLEIAEAVGEVVESRNFDARKAYKVAEAVSGRDQAIQFGLFNREVLKNVAERAASAAISQDPAQAARLSDLWSQINTAIGETETFNLDRKQHVVGTLNKVFDVLHR